MFGSWGGWRGRKAGSTRGRRGRSLGGGVFEAKEAERDVKLAG